MTLNLDIPQTRPTTNLSSISKDALLPTNSHSTDLRRFQGPVSGAMWERLSKLNSRYPDTFDWSIYDRLYDRFGTSQPRGGVVFKTTLKVLNYHTSCSKCHYAFELDTYGRGCVHNCTYCYAKDQLNLHGFWNRPHPMPTDLAEIRRIFYTVFETNKPSKWRAILDKRVPLRIGSMSDSFMWMDLKYKVTQEALKILNFYKYPHIIFTRSDLVAHEDYLKILDRNLVSVQFSISSLHEPLTRLIEPGAPSPARRLKALKTLAEANFWTTVRINPLFPTFPDGFYTSPHNLIERFGSIKNIPKFEFFDLNRTGEFLDQLKEARVPSFLAGFVRLSPVAINNLSKVTGLDIRSFFKPEILKGHGDKHYSDEEIAYYYTILNSEAIKRGLRFNTCYIGNGEKDYYQYRRMWANRKDCCDAIGNVPSFLTTSQAIDWDIRLDHSPNKSIALQSKSQDKENALKYIHLTAITSRNQVGSPIDQSNITLNVNNQTRLEYEQSNSRHKHTMAMEPTPLIGR